MHLNTRFIIKTVQKEFNHEHKQPCLKKRIGVKSIFEVEIEIVIIEDL